MRFARYMPSMVGFASLLAIIAVAAIFWPGAPGGNVPRPDGITVRAGGTETVEYVAGNQEYDLLYSALKGTSFADILEKAIDGAAGLEESDCVLFRYDETQNTASSEPDAPEREYDRLVFIFSGPNAGEAALILNGNILSGTYRSPATAIPPIASAPGLPA